jgi:hypothetical protein
MIGKNLFYHVESLSQMNNSTENLEALLEAGYRTEVSFNGRDFRLKVIKPSIIFNRSVWDLSGPSLELLVFGARKYLIGWKPSYV